MKFYSARFLNKNISKFLGGEKFFSTSRIITPLHYFGQREALVDDLFKLSKTEMPVNNFYDPFSGSGSIGFAAMEQKKAKNFYLNDSLPMLKGFWEWVRINPKSIVDAYYELIEYYYRFPITQRGYVYEKLLKQLNYQRKIFNKPYFAAVFAFLINFSEKNIPIFNENLELAIKPSLKIDHELKLLEMKIFNERVHYLSYLFQDNKVTFSSGDYQKSIQTAGKSDLIIFDPPYPQQPHNIYYNTSNEIDLRKNLSETFQQLNEKQVGYIVLYGAGNIPLSVQFKDLGLQHLIRLSFHTLYGNFLEHLYVSPTIFLNSTNLPSSMVFYDELFKPHKGLPSINYDKALYILQSIKKTEQETPVFNETNTHSFR